MDEIDFIREPQRVCEKCGGAEFYTSKKCKSCVKARNVIYKTKNKAALKEKMLARKAANPGADAARRRALYASSPEKFREASVNWHKENRDISIEKCREWRKSNPEKARASVSGWFAKNPGAKKAFNSNRRARLASSDGHLSAGLADKLFALQKGRCPCCKQPLGDDYHLDHKMPLALGGSNTDENMQLLRKTCNLQKCASHPVDFMKRRGFLL